MAHHHTHAHHHPEPGSRNILLAFWINSAFAVIELIGGFFTNSVAIMSDALHDFGDSLSLGLAWYFEKKSGRRRDEDYSYGYRRFSLLGALINSLILIVGSIFIIIESIERIARPETTDAAGMFFFALLGIVVNGVAMLRLRKGHSVNERVVSLHFLEDVLGWVAVLLGSIIMYFADVPVLDPVLSVLIACYILFNVYKNLGQAFRIILQGIPENVVTEDIKKDVLSTRGVEGIHDFHSWTMDGRYNILTIHLVLSNDLNREQTQMIKAEVRKKVKARNIHHVTIETELTSEPCAYKEC